MMRNNKSIVCAGRIVKGMSLSSVFQQHNPEYDQDFVDVCVCEVDCLKKVILSSISWEMYQEEVR